MDQRLRELERNAATGDLEARARLLLERVRMGELSEERLRLAAHLGDPASQQALGPEALCAPTDLAEWACVLSHWGKEACVRAARAVAVYAIANPGRSPEDRHHDEAALAARTLEQWIECPCPEHEEHADRIAGYEVFSFGLDWLVYLAGREGYEPTDLVDGVLGALRYIELGPYDGSDSALRRAVRAELVPWALGERDPVRMRVAKRCEVEILPEDVAE